MEVDFEGMTEKDTGVVLDYDLASPSAIIALDIDKTAIKVVNVASLRPVPEVFIYNLSRGPILHYFSRNFLERF